MGGFGEILICNVLGYLINLAAGERLAAIHAARKRKLDDALAKDDALRAAVASARPVRDEVRLACAALVRDRALLGVTEKEDPFWRLLGDDAFQSDVADWLMAGGIPEGEEVKARIVRAFERVTESAGVPAGHAEFLKAGFFEQVEKAVFAHPVLAPWRHQQSLNYLRAQVAVLRQRADEAAGVYPEGKRQEAIDKYRAKALNAWDIINLDNLGDGDVSSATQQLLLRQLYMPLRAEVEQTARDRPGPDDAGDSLARFEQRRDARRLSEAGRPPAADAQPPRGLSPIGERLGAAGRLVVVGDPGGGKTTMLRWMATAYLLRGKDATAFDALPDTATLPARDLIPVLIRCRDLREDDLCGCFTDFLTQHLNKTELRPEDARVMCAVILDRIARGEVLLLVDGLDEIASQRVRIQFCEELERTAARYPDAPMIVTSRIVGYRDMPHRMGAGFEHAMIAELSREDKDTFARRWTDVTDPRLTADERAQRAAELIAALHSNDRIERLTGNPMLLTTLALVKRRVGKLPTRRNKLYAEAVPVLLNWNQRIYAKIEEEEAVPQLEYLAHEMCRRGVQRLPEGEVLDLFDRFRKDYPNVRAVGRRKPEEFLQHLEARSSILIKAGGIWAGNTSGADAVWEFRHLTLQEYLAARALVDGRYPDRNKALSLAEQVAPLAGAVEKVRNEIGNEELEVRVSWRETLRLLVADCKDDDVDDVLHAILRTQPGEDAATMTRPRAVLAALCLADEPNVSEQTANDVLTAFANVINEEDGSGPVTTSVDRAAMELSRSDWALRLVAVLVDEFSRRSPQSRERVGSICGMVGGSRHKAKFGHQNLGDLTSQLNEDRNAALAAALMVMYLAFDGPILKSEAHVVALHSALLTGASIADVARLHAIAWALGWISLGGMPRRQSASLQAEEVVRVAQLLDTVHEGEKHIRRWLAVPLGRSGDNRAYPSLIVLLKDDTTPEVRRTAADALGKLGDRRAVLPLIEMLRDADFSVRSGAVEALAVLKDWQAVPPLIETLRAGNLALRHAAVRALGKLGDRRAVPGLSAISNDPENVLRSEAADILRGWDEQLRPDFHDRYLHSTEAEERRGAIRWLARPKDSTDRRLLSCELDAFSPWLDPQEPITGDRVKRCAEQSGMSEEEVRARYEALAAEFHLTLDWRQHPPASG